MAADPQQSLRRSPWTGEDRRCHYQRGAALCHRHRSVYFHVPGDNEGAWSGHDRGGAGGCNHHPDPAGPGNYASTWALELVAAGETHAGGAASKRIDREILRSEHTLARSSIHLKWCHDRSPKLTQVWTGHAQCLVPASSGFPACEDSFTCFSRNISALSSPQAFSVSEELPV